MILLEREPDRVKKEVVDTVSTTVKISVKSLRSLEKKCSLLKLPEEIQNAFWELVALVEGRLPEAIDDGGPAAETPAEPKKKKPVLS